MSKHKYRAVRTESHGIMFDSKGEARRYGELRLMALSGMISELEVQPKVLLMQGLRKAHNVTYKPDFKYRDNDLAVTVYEDFKGVETDRFRLIKKLWRIHGPSVLRVTTAGGKSYEIWPDDGIDNSPRRVPGTETEQKPKQEK